MNVHCALSLGSISRYRMSSTVDAATWMKAASSTTASTTGTSWVSTAPSVHGAETRTPEDFLRDHRAAEQPADQPAAERHRRQQGMPQDVARADHQFADTARTHCGARRADRASSPSPRGAPAQRRPAVGNASVKDGSTIDFQPLAPGHRKPAQRERERHQQQNAEPEHRRRCEYQFQKGCDLARIRPRPAVSSARQLRSRWPQVRQAAPVAPSASIAIPRPR